MTRFSASVVGGGSGGRLSMRALSLSDRYDLVAACDISSDVCQQLQELYPGIRTFTAHDAMFAACPTDVVCVATWPPSHLAVTSAAVETLPLQGILVEKPLADTYAKGAELLDTVKAARLPMAVPHGLLAARHVDEIISRVRNGEIGELRLIEIQCDKWDIINAGIHWLNFAVVVTDCEPFEYVMAQCDDSTRTFRDGVQVETTAVTYAQTQSGIRVVMNTGDYVDVTREGKSFIFRLLGTEGWIEFWAWESAYLIQNAAHPTPTLIEPERNEKPAHQVHLDNLAAQIDSGSPDYTIPYTSLRALELVEAAYLSNRYGCKVDLPLAEFEPPAPNDWQPGKPYSGTGGGRNGRQLPAR